MAQRNSPASGVVVAAAVIVGAGIVAAILAAVGSGFTVTAAFLLLLIVFLGWIAVSVARRAAGGTVAPVACTQCGELNAASASHCRQCGRAL